MRQKRFLLPTTELPTHWYNIQAEMATKPLPLLNPQTHKPIQAEDLFPLFSREASRQEVNQTDVWIEIPDEVRQLYSNYRTTPLVRAYALEEALDTPAHIYFKNESVSPVGSHKLNSQSPKFITVRKRVSPMSPQRRAPDNGVPLWRMHANFSGWSALCIK